MYKRQVLTRVKSASVSVDGKTIGSIGPGFLILLGITHDDTEAQAVKLADKLTGLRIFEDEDGRLDYDPADGYYGEVDYRMRYGAVKGRPFDWLYADFDTLAAAAGRAGFKAELLLGGDHYDYLARISRR